jgi:hypothetical protein
LGSIFLGVASLVLPEDIHTLRGQMRQRAERERALQAGQAAD